MVDIAGAPEGPITISEKDFTIAKPFGAGHVLNEGQAAALNQVLAENVRNNFARKVKKAVDDKSFDQDALQAELNAYVSSYEFGVRQYSPKVGTMSAVDKRAHKLAKEAVKAALTAKGRKVRDIPVEQLDDLAAQLVEKNESFKIEAARQLDAAKLIGDINLGGVEASE